LQSLSIIVPAFNEERRLPATLEALTNYLQSRKLAKSELIVVDDGSTDRTADIVRQWRAKRPEVRLVHYEPNRGKGYAINRGIFESRCEWVLLTDADLSAPIEDLALLEAAIERTGAMGAIGSRAVNRELVGKHQPFPRELMGRIFNLAMMLITGLRFKDTQCGFKLFRADAAKSIAVRRAVDGFGFDVEMLFLAKRLSYQIEEVPVRWDNIEGTKVSLWKGLGAFADLLRVRWNASRGMYR
jgi:dolichyl-phosphate beta-glucosyltransferase